MSAMPKITLGETQPPYTASLLNGDGTPLDLTDQTVQFKMRMLGASTDTVLAPATIVGSPTLGKVKYEWNLGDTDVAGLYSVYWIVTGDVALTYPSDDSDMLAVVTGPNIPFTYGSCVGWTTEQEVRACTNALNTVSAAMVNDAIDMATDLLYVLSGQQYPGECVKVLRPCPPPNLSCFGDVLGGVGGIDTTLRGHHVDLDYPYEHSSCSCHWMPKIDLGYWPVVNVAYVKIDGVTIDPSTYRLDERKYLVRLANPTDNYSNPGWPLCQRLDRASDAPETFEVMIEHGVAPPPSGRAAARKLAGEMAKACAGMACALPGKVTSVHRQGVAMTLIDPAMLDKGLTGVYEVDLFLKAHNPNGRRGKSVMWSPDLPRENWHAGV